MGNHEKDFQGPSATILSKMVHSELWHFFLMKFQYVIPAQNIPIVTTRKISSNTLASNLLKIIKKLYQDQDKLYINNSKL